MTRLLKSIWRCSPLTQPLSQLAEGSIVKSKVFENADFGYYKVTVERPLRLAAQFTEERLAALRFSSRLQGLMEQVYAQWGDRVYTDLATL